MLPKTKPYVVLLIVLAIAIAPLVPFGILDKYITPSNANMYSVTAQENLQAYVGDLAVDRIESAPWRGATDVRKEMAGRQMTGHLWYKLDLIADAWRDPYLFVQGFLHYEVYLNGTKILERNMGQPYARHVVPPSNLGSEALPSGLSDSTLYIHAYKDNEIAGAGWVYIRSFADQLAMLFGEYSYLLVLSLVSALVGAGAVVFFVSRRERSYMYFALFAFYLSSLCVGRSFPFFQLFADSYLYVYYLNAFVPLGVMAFLLFYESVFGSGYRNIVRRMWQFMPLLFLVMICAARFHPPVYPTLHTFFNVLMLPIIAIVLAHSVSHYRRYRTAESLWYLAGFSALGPILAVYSLSVAGIWWVWLDRLIFEQSRFLHAFFVLLFCMGMVLRVRVRSVYAQVESHAAELERLNGSLEHLVQERTAELEHANRHLIDSVHETAQALAEVSVLEERTRIAHDMHDQVGHTLTAAMIQIEAAKLLLAGDPDRAAMKMDAARETVREGLDHVRRTVRVLKTADEQEALPPALLGLIRRTEEQTGINVEYSITPLPVIDEALSATLYRALQEGLTNGMRHGGSTKFAFELSFEGSSIRFRLSSDGRKYEPGPFGFGLTAMKERVERHGGTFAIAANGNSGCLLAIDIPLSESP